MAWGIIAKSATMLVGFFTASSCPKGTKIVVLPGKEPANILRRARQRVVAGYGDEHRTAVAQVAFRRHGHRGVGDGMGELCQRISGAGGDDEDVEQLLWPHRLHLGKGVQRRRAAMVSAMTICSRAVPEAAVNAISGVGENGVT